jgi:hypothetical protein
MYIYSITAQNVPQEFYVRSIKDRRKQENAFSHSEPAILNVTAVANPWQRRISGSNATFNTDNYMFCLRKLSSGVIYQVMLRSALCFHIEYRNALILQPYGTWVRTYQNTRCNISEDFNIRGRKNSYFVSEIVVTWGKTRVKTYTVVFTFG